MRIEYKYEPETLKKLQRIELDMFKVFDDICVKYNIEYFVGFGTAIGAIRHKGFIPWDDDIDVCMMREEYIKLKNVPKEEWNGLVLSDPCDGNSIHTLIYPQIYLPGSIFETEYHYRYDEYPDMNGFSRHPIWLDIFLFDRIEGTEKIKEKVGKAFLYQKLFYYSKSKIKVLAGDPIKLKFICALKRIVHYLLKFLKKPDMFIYRKYIELVNTNAGNYVTSFDLERKEQMYLCCSKYEDMFPTVRVPFENMMVNIQKNYHDALTKQYGDYMKLPDESKRYNHPPRILDFGDGNGNNIK